MKLASYLIALFLLLPRFVSAADQIINIYAYTGEIPDFVVRQFEKETHIKVNLSTYENNEIMYAKLRANKNAGYDIVMPSSYFVDRMRRQNLLEELDQAQLPGIKNLNPTFKQVAYDVGNRFSIPYIWGVTGIFYNSSDENNGVIQRWSDLWDSRFYNKLMLLDDSREVFSMALLSLGYPANDSDPQHIKAAFLKLKELMKNVRVFSTETVVAIMIDEDATVGMAWNGDTYKASLENPHVKFVFPKEGFVIWVDNISIPKSAPHKSAAYAFINFVLRPDISRAIALYTHYPTTNLAAQKLLPAAIRNNPVVYPSKDIMKRGQFQTDLSEETLALYEKYWEELKMSG